MDDNQVDKNELISEIRKMSRRLCPDYPGIEADLGVYEHLWAMYGQCRGVELANKDWLKFGKFLIDKLQWNHVEALDKFKTFTEGNNRGDNGGNING